MNVTAINPSAALEQRIADARKADAESDPERAKLYRDVARSHYQHMAGLISMRSDARIGQMEREKGLR